ncbi:MAG: TetR/AcrR family transcriptional regulator C-terminal domain-containing protein, partial [Thermodesulfobacteriota bacterium]
AAETALPRLSAALARSRVADPRAELEGVVRELYELVERTRLGTALIERSALDQPALATLFYVDVRRKLIERLTRYLERRIRSGALRPVPDPPTAARLILETITWFARHRMGDADSAAIDDAAARETTVDFLVHGLAAAGRAKAAPRRR